MLFTTRTRAAQLLRRRLQTSSPALRTYATSEKSSAVPVNANTPKKDIPNVSATEATPTEITGIGMVAESARKAEELRARQAPNRDVTWSRSQNPREKAMSGPRFEQTLMEFQPMPHAAIELIHKQPVRWTHDRFVSCDGGGGPLGHPRVFINVDKPQICTCGYCGLPFANEHHREYLEALPSTNYPLKPLDDPATVNESQRITDKGYEQR